MKKLRTANHDVTLVTAADKLHNLSTLVRDVRRDGPQTMSRFNAPPERVVWYHGAVAEALEAHSANTPVAEIEEVSAKLAALLGLGDSNDLSVVSSEQVQILSPQPS